MSGSVRVATWARWTTALQPGLFLLGAVLAAAGLTYLTLHAPMLAAALFAAGVLVLIFVRRPVAVAVLAVPGTVLVQRALGGAISYADVLTTVAAILALPAIQRYGLPKAARPLMAGLFVYIATLVAAFLYNPSMPSGLEIMHRAVLVGGSLIVGVWIASEDRVRTALRLLVAVVSVLGIAAIITSVQHDFRPAYPLGFHKNFAGSMLAASLLVLLAAPRYVGFRIRWRYLFIAFSGLGLVATQSRGAMLAAVFGALAWFLLSQSEVRRRSFWAAVVLAIGFTVFAGWSTAQQLSDERAVEGNSFVTRLEVQEATMGLWRTSPVVGVGVRYYESGRFVERSQLIEPINAVQEALAESGLIGAVGFIVLHLMALGSLLVRRGQLAVLAFALVGGHLVHGMVDIYWTAGNSALPFMVAGMALVWSEPRWSRTRRQPMETAA